MKYIQNIFPVLVFCTIMALPAMAQPSGPAAPTPFGFVEFLIGAGAVLGAKKVYQNRKKP